MWETQVILALVGLGVVTVGAVTAAVNGYFPWVTTREKTYVQAQSELVQQVDRLDKRIVYLEAKVDRLRDDLTAAHTQIATLEREKALLQVEFRQVLSLSEERLLRIEVLDLEVARLKRQAEELEQEIRRLGGTV